MVSIEFADNSTHPIIYFVNVQRKCPLAFPVYIPAERMKVDVQNNNNSTSDKEKDSCLSIASLSVNVIFSGVPVSRWLTLARRAPMSLY